MITCFVFCAIIVAAGFWILGQIAACNRKFKEIKAKSGKIYKKTRSDARVDVYSRNLEYSENTNLDIEAMNEQRTNYNAVAGRFHSCVQSISIFPLLGLLGTVWGLIPGLAAVNTGDIEVLYSSLSTALYSTLVGIVWSIVLKFYVAYGPSPLALSIENNFAENDRQYDLSLAFNKITENMSRDKE